MPTTPKSCSRRGQEPEKNRRNKLKEKASSFHGKIPLEAPEARIRRPSTLPDLLQGRNLSAGPVNYTEARPKLTKLLLNVTVQGSVGAVQVLSSPDCTVGDLMAATIRQYLKEGRRPVVAADATKFDLHYSQFSLESLNREEKLISLGSRNFFMCAKKASIEATTGSKERTSLASSCSNEVEKAIKRTASPWLKFIDFLL